MLERKMRNRKQAHSFILASESGRRLSLLHQMGLYPDIIFPAPVDETPMRKERPSALALRVAMEKASYVADIYPNCWILAAYTVVGCGRRCLGKASNKGEAEKLLRILSGRRHKVTSGVCFISPKKKFHSKLVTTTVKLKRLSERELYDYLKSREWEGKAGGYAIQSMAATFITWISGSYSNVAGLPIYETFSVMRGAGFFWSPSFYDIEKKKG